MRRLSGFEPAIEAVARSRLAGGGHTMVCPYGRRHDGRTIPPQHLARDSNVSGRHSGLEPAREPSDARDSPGVSLPGSPAMRATPRV